MELSLNEWSQIAEWQKELKALRARLAEVEKERDEAVENGMALSASCCPWVNKGGLYAGDGGHIGCAVKARLAEVEAQRDVWQKDMEAVLSQRDDLHANVVILSDALRKIETLYWHDAPCPQDMRDIAREALAKLEAHDGK